jgi:hypothetical protein
VFEAYLVQHGEPVPQHEPDLGVIKRPDYLIERDGYMCVCEVKEFANRTASFRGAGGTTSPEVVLSPMRSQIREAARQLKPLAGNGMPLVIVLTNPHAALVLTDPSHVVHAMYGDPIVTIPIDAASGGADGDAVLITGRNGKLRMDHPYISALVLVRYRDRAADFYDTLNARNAALTPGERLDAVHAAKDAGQVPEGRYLCVDVFPTLSLIATTLPDVFFNGPDDCLFQFDGDARAYRKVRGPNR